MKPFRRSVQIGWLVSLMLGTLLHFTYDWSGNNRVVGLYSAMNESVWEHLKLLFFPVLLYTILEYLWIGHRKSGYVLVRAKAALWGMLAIVACYYTYTGIVGRGFLAADLILFLIGTAITAWYTWRQTPNACGGDGLGVLLFAVIAVCFGVFLTRSAEHRDLYRPITSCFCGGVFESYTSPYHQTFTHCACFRQIIMV